MPQPKTTHKDLHRAALGSVLSWVYLLAISLAYAENPPHTASANPAVKPQAKLVKNEAAKMPPATGSLNAPLKPAAAPTAAIPARGGKLREIPFSTLEGDKSKGQKDTKDTKSPPESPKVGGDSKADGQPKTEKSGAIKPVKKTASAKSRQSTAQTPRLNNGLIPPPPPIVPIGMDALSMYAQPVDFLSLKELEGRKKELTARFNELDANVSDGERQIRERKERAELFESLYQEGVVSRKELETAKREAGDINRDLKFKQDELESVKISMKAVNNRLAVLKKMEARLNAGKKNNPSAPQSAKKK